jgi:spoIIIJ-associated protein
MDFVETEGETIDEAIDKALEILAVDRDKVTVDILTEGTKGFLGIGAVKARIRASLRKSLVLEEEKRVGPEKSPDRGAVGVREIGKEGERGKEILSRILQLMGIPATVEVRAGEAEEEVVLDIRGENSALLIGRRGQTLEALQYLLTRIMSGSWGGDGPQVVIDTENYRQRHRQSLEDMALRYGEKAKRQRKTLTLGYLDASDRRIVHLTLQDDPWLTTRSVGKGPYRRLLIIPEGDRRDNQEEIKGKLVARQGAKSTR